MECQKCGAVISYYVGEPEICPECGELMLKEEDCPVCHGAGATTDHHDPCTECGGSGKVGG